VPDNSNSFERVATFNGYVNNLYRWPFALLELHNSKGEPFSLQSLSPLEADGAKIGLEPTPILLTSLAVNDLGTIHCCAPSISYAC
jgi:hypothetical protein